MASDCFRVEWDFGLIENRREKVTHKQHLLPTGKEVRPAM